ncbi:lasso peptide biosynthesis B2 protein [Streptomyces alboflavus]|uniref:lasso peptide biosynthesis B2 protein n=1 Tax=Streptomyces alboflavus TaxID=67267 RepID=UPI000998565A|nr:lasso peptide biosynthesis B2 protein [Streptomyces alboflavus]
MTLPELPSTKVQLSFSSYLATTMSVTAARALARQKPKHIKAALANLRTGARPATFSEAQHARDSVLTVSPRCSGERACLLRSIASVLLCRMRGVTPTWCVGVLTTPPFTAHAWIESEGRSIGEELDATCYRRLIEIGPAQ